MCFALAEKERGLAAKRLRTVAVPDINFAKRILLVTCRPLPRLALPYSATGGGHARSSLAGKPTLGSNLSQAKRKQPDWVAFFLAEKERFELSRRLPDLHP